MRKKPFISFQERVEENIQSILQDQEQMEKIDEKIEQRHNDRLKQIPS
ncbi:FbpB family small basic protein [Halobacillus salinarum]|uniref:FbpB family small basic protein n=1 Tax=Halobacillus salinarum TaxID=2932257 RepID=A0ABY4ELI4_9BACI|nr:FbpB family small basic protein [Halobacillus salinarum]UOQ42956.1 FbpB family small basic protein [Halobacillus salinarum]